MTTKPTRLDEIRARLAAATPGPWRYDGMHNEITTPQGNDGYWLIVSECRSAPDQVLRQEAERNCFDANFDLIAHMREDMAKLVAVVEATLGGRSISEMLNDVEESVASDDGYHSRDERAPWEALT